MERVESGRVTNQVAEELREPQEEPQEESRGEEPRATNQENRNYRRRPQMDGKDEPEQGKKEVKLTMMTRDRKKTDIHTTGIALRTELHRFCLQKQHAIHKKKSPIPVRKLNMTNHIFSPCPLQREAHL